MSTALYRRYRPETFADVIGQEHVTVPLMQALRTNRVNHAYLFSGPRGCGKTTSARILARILNCARWEPGDDGTRPDSPCGECDSCVELSRGGSGSLDVVEIDAASHGGVDDARELRERATFAPARDRYKIFVIDEAHMVTTAGFNALLKIVEEPPEHVRFIFATTEPDKVLPTIRSRTHHYPFHLVPSERLLRYLDELCQAEGVPVGKGVLPLVVRAGAGSVRDSLSVLDQLMAGAGPDGVDYERAVSLLGYTHATLLDDVVDALAAGDGASVFRVVDRVIESGHDPRRFVEDLLERMRDLIVIRAVGEGARAVLRALPEDQLARMSGQAERFGAGELSRAADVANAALTEMTGATSPRLHLELLCARMLLPGSENTERGLTARLDRLERRIRVATWQGGAPMPSPAPVHPGVTGGEADHADAPGAERGSSEPQSAAPQSAAPRSTALNSAALHGAAPSSADQRSAAPSSADQRSAAPPSGDRRSAPPSSADRAEQRSAPAGANARTADPGGAGPGGADPRAAAPGGAAAPAAATNPRSGPSAPAADAQVPPGDGRAGASELDAVRRMWPDVLERLKSLKRTTWSTTSHAHVLGVSGGVLRLGFTNAGALAMFSRGAHAEFVRQALIDVLGLDVKVEPTAASDEPPATQGGNGRSSSAAPPEAGSPGERRGWDAPAAAPAGRQTGDEGEPQAHPPEHSRPREPGVHGHVPQPEPEPAPEPEPEAPLTPQASARAPRQPAAQPSVAARESVARESVARESVARESITREPVVAPEHDVPDLDDPDAEDSGLMGPQLVERLLGGKVIQVED